MTSFCQSLDEQALDLRAGPDLKSITIPLPAENTLPTAPSVRAADTLPADAVVAVPNLSTESGNDTAFGWNEADETADLSAASEGRVLATTKTYDNQAVELAQRLEGETLKRLETPRTRESCRRLGIRLEDLHAKTLQHFKCVGDSIDRVRMRFNHYETKRQVLLKKVLHERGKIVAEKYENRSGPGKMQSLQLMEELLDKEAKRLEKELRSQVRCHSAMEKENDCFQQKEQALQKRIQYRLQRNSVKARLDEDRAEAVREDAQSRCTKVEQKKAQLEQEDEARQATHLALLLEDEVRLMEFGKEKEVALRERAEIREQHKHQIGKLRETDELDRHTRATELYQKLEEKVENLLKRKEDMAHVRELKAEERNLRIVDAMDRKGMLERQHDFRREQMAKQLRAEEGRVEQLCVMKDQILEQRKLRHKQVAYVGGGKHSGRSLVVRGDGPGPAAYNTREALMAERYPGVRGVKISSGNTRILIPNSIDEMIDRTKLNPAPGFYDPKVLAKGGKTDLSGGHGRILGVTISNTAPRNFIDEQERRSAMIPGPGAYKVQNTGTAVGTKIVRNYVSTAKDARSWVNHADTPGPAAYMIDPFLRHERIMRQNRSLPTLCPNLKNA
eukprot:GEMP01039018.1.p1 GENE.GEMP01039018.1~~GEMP01039018.1.p1  ORF type:complete len:618 (+),score=156.12 GEMP01039018.1:42-1895(+)